MELKKHNGLTIYYQIAETLSEQIKTGVYKTGDFLPTEKQLAAFFGVNRHTVRRAVENLIDQGLVNRIHGRGSRVIPAPITYHIHHKTRFTENISSLGLTPAGRLLRQLVIRAEVGVAGKLKIEVGDEIVMLEILRTVDYIPFCVVTSFLPCDRFPGLERLYKGDGSLHGFISEQYGVQVFRKESVISTRMPEGEDASCLQLPAGTPVLIAKSLNVADGDSAPVEYAITRFRGDIAQIMIELEPREPGL